MSSALDPYRPVLRNRRLTRLLAGEFISGIGDWLYLVAILVLVFERTQDPILVGIVGAARVLPYLLLSIPAGIVADRFDRRTILIVTDIARGVLMLSLAALIIVGVDVIAVIGVAVAATVFSTFFGPAIGAFLPSLVEDESDNTDRRPGGRGDPAGDARRGGGLRAQRDFIRGGPDRALDATGRR